MPNRDLGAHGAQYLYWGGVFHIGTGNHRVAGGKDACQARHPRTADSDEVDTAEIVVCGVGHLFILPSGGVFGLKNAGGNAVCDGIGYIPGTGVGCGVRHRIEALLIP